MSSQCPLCSQPLPEAIDHDELRARIQKLTSSALALEKNRLKEEFESRLVAARKGVESRVEKEMAAALRLARPGAGLIIFSYYNPVLRFGLESFCAAAEQAGVDGVLITDMIVEEAGDYLEAMHRHGLAPIFLAAPTSPDDRLERIASASQGFVYAISRTGITGTRVALESDAEQLVRRLRKFTKLPIAVGFGISNPEHFAAVGEFADAAVIGSALVATIEQAGAKDAPSSIARFIGGLRAPVPAR